MQKLRFVALAVILIALAVFALRTTPAAAHEGHTVGPYSVELGWRVEPAYVGLYNGPEVFISMKDDEKQKIEGAEKTLKLEVSFGKDTRLLKLEAAYQDPGHYVANLIPTRAGDYLFHLTGKINDTLVDETYSSASGKFSPVEPVEDILFPDKQMDLSGLQAQIDAQKADIAALKAEVEALKVKK